ncbi:phage portal protein [Candidatus Dojkabacteria bacterium]|jgi:hypothetical protein|nr:phage portal protein [Candidatus Dojkabacteria bacterium]
MKYKFVKYNAVKTPEFLVDKKSEMIKFGKDNKYPNFLLDLSTKTGLHTAILNTKKLYIIGNGLTYEGNDKKTDNFLLNANPYESMDEIFEKCTVDLEIFGGFSLETIWTRDKKSIAEIYHIPFQNIRATKQNRNNIVEKYLYHSNWNEYTRIKEAIEFKRFGDSDKNNNQLLYTKQYNPINQYYPIPEYVGAIQDINTLSEISSFHNAAIKNNFNPGMMIIFRGPLPSEEEQDAIIEGLEEKYRGTNNAGTPSVFFLPENQEKPTLEQMSVSDLDKQYQILTEAMKENVVLGHQIPRIIAGLEKEGSLGGGKEYVDAELIFKNKYIVAHQNILLNSFNKIMKVNNMNELHIKNLNTNLLLYSDSLIEKILTIDEIRNLFGYEEKINNNNE